METRSFGSAGGGGDTGRRRNSKRGKRERDILVDRGESNLKALRAVQGSRRLDASPVPLFGGGSAWKGKKKERAKPKRAPKGKEHVEWHRNDVKVLLWEGT